MTWQFYFIALFVCISTSSYAKGNATDPDIIEAYESFLHVLHGESVIANPSVAYCVEVAKQKIALEKKWTTEWFEGKGECKAEYIPDITSFSTPVGRGMFKHFLFKEKLTVRLMDSLNSMTVLIAEGRKLSLLDKLDMQTSVWEFVLGLEWRRKLKLPWSENVDQQLVEDMLRTSLKLLNELLFSNEDINSLPNNLNILSKQFPVLSDQSAFKSLIGRDSGVLEDLYPTVVHSEMLALRVNQRIFITSDNDGTKKRIQEFILARSELLDEFYVPELRLEGFSWLTGKMAKHIRKMKYPELKKYLSPYSGQRGSVSEFAFLHRWLPDIRTVLVTYFNVLDENYNIRQTKLVHSWNEIWYSGKINWENGYTDVGNKFNFHSIGYKKSLGNSIDKPMARYEIIEGNELTRIGLVDASPAVKLNVTLTTNSRNNCIMCHGRVISTFGVRVLRDGWPKKLGFTTPFLKQNPILENANYVSESRHIENVWDQLLKKYDMKYDR